MEAIYKNGIFIFKEDNKTIGCDSYNNILYYVESTTARLALLQQMKEAIETSEYVVEEDINLVITN